MARAETKISIYTLVVIWIDCFFIKDTDLIRQRE